MILNFKKEINGKPTNFKQKILNSFKKLAIEKANIILFAQISDIHKGNFKFDLQNSKLHTIRPDVANRFKAGVMIDFKEWSGRPYHSKNISFAPRIPVVSVQNISIKEWLAADYSTCFQMPDNSIYTIEIDGIRQDKKQIKRIAINDGFENEVEFFNYLRRFEGKLIHWTNLKY